MASINPLTAGLIVLAFIAGIGVGYLLPTQSEPAAAGAAETCPAKITSLDALAVALDDPGVLELLDNKSIDTIAFSKDPYPGRGRNYTQIVFRIEDPDPDDHETASMIIVQINDSCMVDTAYQTYPSYIPKIAPEI